MESLSAWLSGLWVTSSRDHLDYLTQQASLMSLTHLEIYFSPPYLIQSPLSLLIPSTTPRTTPTALLVLLVASPPLSSAAPCVVFGLSVASNSLFWVRSIFFPIVVIFTFCFTLFITHHLYSPVYNELFILRLTATGSKIDLDRGQRNRRRPER